MPNRYEPAPGLSGRVDLTLRRLSGLANRTVPHFVEAPLFPPAFPAAAGPLRAIARRVLRARLDELAASFDAPFYLRQITDVAERRRAEPDPILHYATVGWMRERAAAPRFDPEFHRREACLSPATDPYVDYLRRSPEAPANESEAAGVPPSRVDAERSGSVLTVHHARGGGSSEYLRRYEARLRGGGRQVYRLRAVPGAPHMGVIDEKTEHGVRAFAFDLVEEAAGLVRFARERRVSLVVVNHMIDRPIGAFDWIRSASAGIGCGYEAILHDYFAVCPRVDLVTGAGRCCEVAPIAACEGCVAASGSQADAPPKEWRAVFAAFLAGASKVVVPSDDLAVRLSPHLPGVFFEVWEPHDGAVFPTETTPRLASGENLRLATIGSLNVPKGARVVLGLAQEVAASRAPVSLTVVGPSSDASALRRSGVEVFGRYAPSALDGLVARAAPHAVLLPAIWPETWSFVLSEALQRGLPVIAFDIGAPAARLRRLGRGELLPVSLAHDPVALTAAILSIRRGWVA